MKLYLKTLCLLSFCCFLNNFSIAQNFTINQGGTHTTCSTMLFDSDSVALYQDNESYTITICGDGSGGSNSVNVGFGELFKIDPSDTLFIYDGNSTASPLIGAYNNDIQPVGVTTSTSNPSGCMTFQFVSDVAVVDSGWRAIVNCVKVCQPINPIVTTTPALTSYGPDSNYTNICAGDAVSFVGSAEYPHNGLNAINYTQNDASSTFEWSFGEGTELTAPTGTITYNNEGGYAVLLTVTDANNCQEQIIHKVRTGLTPAFSGIFAAPDTACFGDTIQLVGGFNQTTGASSGVAPNTGAITAGGTVTGQTFLPDGNGNSYTTTVGISGFPGQTINAGTDVQEVCMNIEHSYIGDLDFQLTCPNGTTIMLSDTYNGGGSGGTFLGDANDDGSTDPGIGMDYCFTLGATMGTMVDENIAGNYIPSTFDPGNNILIPGDFQPEEHFNNLIGCPIDGSWTITVTDNIGSDNGFIFEWGITLNPAINPNAEFYDVAIVDGFWQTSPDFVAEYDTLTTAFTQNGGENNYVFQVTDEYGCDFDTTITVVVLEELIAIATPDTNLCAGQEVTFNVGGFSTASDNFTLNMVDSWGDGWNDQSIDVYEDGVLIGNYTIIDGDTASGYFTMSPGNNIVIVYNTGSFQSESSFDLFDSSGNIILSYAEGEMSGLNQGDTIYTDNIEYTFSWGPVNDLSDPTAPDPIFNGTTTSTYAVEMYFTEHPECSVISDSITVTVNNLDLPTIFGDSAVCIGFPATYVISGADSIIWPDNSNDSIYTFIPQNDSILTVTASTFCGNITWNKHVVVYPEIDLLASPDTIICEGEAIPLSLNGILDECTYLLTLTDAGGDGWSGFEGVDIKINTVLYEGGFSVPSCSGATCTTSMVIPINEGDILTIEYVSGPTDAENTVELFDASNTSLLNITSPVAGVIGTFNATCSNAYDIAWTPSTQLSDATIAAPMFTAATPEIYEAIVFLNSNSSCADTSNTINIDVRSIEPPVITGDTTVCLGGIVSLTINADTILWWGDTLNVSNSFVFTPPYDSTVTATASTFCVQNAVVTHFVEVFPLPVITGTGDTSITIQDEVSITTTGGEIYSWSPNIHLSCDDCPDPIASPTETTLYYVSVTDSNGCVTGKYLNIEVIIPDLFIPNGFSPNNDGVNDFVDIRSLSIVSMTMQIYDRWGALIFESSDQENSWDGTYNGKNLDAGVYVYKFEARMVDKELIEQSGTITLFR